MIYPTITGHDGCTLTGWDGTALNTDGFSALLIEVTAIAGSVTLKGGINAATPLTAFSVSDTAFTPLAAITATGLYQVSAAGAVTAVISGAATMNVEWKVSL